jgi:hypothetical protein
MNIVKAAVSSLLLIVVAGLAFAQEATNIMKFDVTFSPFNLLDLGEQGISVGDHLLFDDELFSSGESVGRDGGFCVITRVQPDGPDPLLDECVVTFSLPDGQIVGEGLVSDAPKKILAITGGTGKYTGASGQLTLEEFGNGKGSVTLELKQ